MKTRKHVSVTALQLSRQQIHLSLCVFQSVEVNYFSLRKCYISTCGKGDFDILRVQEKRCALRVVTPTRRWFYSR